MINILNINVHDSINECHMDTQINVIYQFKTSNTVDSKLRFESVRNLPTIERYFKYLIDNIH